MHQIHFAKNYENSSHFNEDQLFLISMYITFYADGCIFLPDNLYITSCDIDRIYLSTNPEATPESAPNYIIRTWDYHICEEDPERVHMDWTIHLMEECDDGVGRSSAEQMDGSDDILVYGELAKMRVSVLKGLTTIHIPGSVTVISKDAFKGCSNLKEVYIPEGVTIIEAAAFEYCESLSKVNLPDSLTEIGAFAFSGCTSLQKIHIPDNVIVIGPLAFSSCNALVEFSTPLLNISELGLRKDTHVNIRANGGEKTIPDGITRIPSRAFMNCSELKSLRIPNSVTWIGGKAFSGCLGIHEIHIPDSVMGIGENAFEDCKNLTEISVPLGLNITAAGFGESTKVVIRDSGGTRVLPEGVTEITDSAFKDCTVLKGVVIPDSVTSIGEYAFWGCTGLSEIHIPASVTSIGENAFWGCRGLSTMSVSPENAVYDSRDNCNAIIETATGRIIAACKDTVLPDSWFQSICDIYGFIGSDDPDEEFRILTILKNNFNTKLNLDDDYELAESIKRYVAAKYHKEWYKNYIGTRKIDFDRPSGYLGEEILDEGLIDAFISDDYMISFIDYRLKTGHTERQDMLTQFMRHYPSEVLDWLGDDYSDGSAVPYGLFKRLAQGGDYELFGLSKDEFLENCEGDGNESEMPFEYAAVLEENYGVDYAVDYLNRLEPWDCLIDCSDSTQALILSLFSKADRLNEDDRVLRDLAYFFVTLDLDEYDDKEQSALSVEMLSRLAAMWKKGLITDEWLTDDDRGLTGIVDFEWGDDYWEEEMYPEIPDECRSNLWLLKLLESDFTYDIADYLRPLLEMVLEKEKNHNWEAGKKAIESFLDMNVK